MRFKQQVGQQLLIFFFITGQAQASVRPVAPAVNAEVLSLFVVIRR
jgi:hypothetical protein